MPALRHYLYNSAGMSERIEINRHGGLNPEFFLEIYFALADLADYPLAAGHKAVGLQKPPAHYVPFAFLYKTLYLAKERGCVLFGIFI